MGAPGPTIGASLRGRANRKEYWVFIGGLFAVGLILAEIAPIASIAGAGVVLYAQVRRLHDFGRTGWWAAAALLAQIPLVAVLFSTLGEEMTLLVGNGLMLLPIAWIGAIPGDPHDNRFGPPPGQRPLGDVFR